MVFKVAEYFLLICLKNILYEYILIFKQINIKLYDNIQVD